MLSLNEIYCGPNVDLCKQIDSESVHLVITSPPYDLLRSYQSFDFDFPGIALELTRILVPGGIIVWVVGDAVVHGSETGSSFKQALYFKESCGLRLHDTMIYLKTGKPYPPKNRYFSSFEYMFCFSKGAPRVFNPICDRKNSNAGQPAHWGKITYRQKDGSLKETTKNYIVPEFGLRNNVWEYKTGGGNVTRDKIAYKHPAIFPEKLVEDHLKSWSNPGDLVLDPFNGSGTTTKICKLLQRNFIGIDCSEEYCGIARERLTLVSSNF